MIIFENLDDITGIEPTVVALGNFDGVHYGHQEVIKNVVKKAKADGLKAAVFTFSNHPKDLLPGAEKVKCILAQEDKFEIIENLGVDYLFSVPFDKDIMTMDRKDFVEKLLLDKFNMKAAYCGFNYSFGYKAKGNPDFLREMGESHGFEVNAMDPYMINGNVVSSTFIRKLIADGDVDQCETYMGRNYFIEGEVVVGNRLGRTIGFPTSNLVIDPGMVTPPNGVYVTYCTYNGVRYPSITNVGVKPTIGTYNKNVETHIFNFNKELYGKEIKVEFLKKTRDEVKFDDINKLSDQIVRDCIQAKKFHEDLGSEF